METDNQSSFILPMPQDFPSGIADEDRLCSCLKKDIPVWNMV